LESAVCAVRIMKACTNLSSTLCKERLSRIAPRSSSAFMREPFPCRIKPLCESARLLQQRYDLAPEE
jgi:hypothetical protein